MLVKSITEEEIYGIGHAFGDYDYGEETGMSAAFSGKEATANYICAYVRGGAAGRLSAHHQRAGRGIYRLHPAGTENEFQSWHGYPQSSVSQYEP